MNKNHVLRKTAAWLWVLAVLSAGMLAGSTQAKYMAQAEGSAGVQVAKFGFAVTEVTALGTAEPTPVSSNEISLVLAGNQFSYDTSREFIFKVENKSDVTVNCELDTDFSAGLTHSGAYNTLAPPTLQYMGVCGTKDGTYNAGTTNYALTIGGTCYYKIKCIPQDATRYEGKLNLDFAVTQVD